MTWSEEAACTGTSLDMWFPVKGTAAHAAYATAQWYCDRCPVRRECLQEALDVEPPGARYGMRAGLTPAERVAIYDGDVPFPDFPPPPTIHRPEGAAVTVTDISPTAQQQPAAVPSTAEELIAWGAAQPTARIQGMAGKAHRALVDLRQEAERQTRVAESEARVARLKAQLANAEQDLRAAKGGSKAAGAAPASGEDYAAIRQWAREAGLVVADVGRPARAVIDAYHAARPAA